MNVAVVLVTFNRLECLKHALECYKKQSIQPSHVIVVNNASTDGTAEFLNEWLTYEQTSFEKQVINLPENTGGSGGFYAGLERARDLDVDWIWLSDDDAYPEAGVFSVFDSWLKVNDGEEVAALCTAVTSHGEFDTGHRRRLTQSGIRLIDTSVQDDEYKSSFTLNLFTFVGVAVKTSVVRKIGLPEKDFFIWWDDNEYSLRVSKIGEIVCLPEAITVHDVDADARIVCWKSYYGMRNRLYTYKRYFGVASFLYHFLGAYKRYFTLLKDEKWRPYADLIRQGALDAAKGKLGKHPVYVPGWKPGD